MTGTVRFIAPEAEYTPPVIYSVGSREQAGVHGRGLARPTGITLESRPAGATCGSR